MYLSEHVVPHAGATEGSGRPCRLTLFDTLALFCASAQAGALPGDTDIDTQLGAKCAFYQKFLVSNSFA